MALGWRKKSAQRPMPRRICRVVSVTIRPLHSELHAKSWVFASWFNSSFWNVDGKNPSLGKSDIAMGLQNAAMHKIIEIALSTCFWHAKFPSLLVMGQLLTSSMEMLWSEVFPVRWVSVPQFSSCGKIWTSMTSWPGWPSRDSSVRFTLVWNGAISVRLLFVEWLLRWECLWLLLLTTPELRLRWDLLLLSDFTDSVSIINW